MVDSMHIIYVLALVIGAASSPTQPLAQQKPPSLTAACDGEVGAILKELRGLMSNGTALQGTPIQAYIVPLADAHQNEYVAEQDKRLQYITKFSGSAGQAIVTTNAAALWTDSRYHLQAERQVDINCWDLMKQGLSDVPSTAQWLITNLPSNSTVGVDPFLMTAKDYSQLGGALNASGLDLISVSSNLVDAIWISRPMASKTRIVPLDIKYSGKESGLKISELLDAVRGAGGESIVITSLDDIAWLLNLRGSDISYTPIFFSYVLLSPTKSYLLVDAAKIDAAATTQLAVEHADLVVRDYSEVLDAIVEIVNKTTGKMMTSSTVSQALARLIPDERRLDGSVVASMKSVKNPIEAQNMERAHIRDGLALIMYMHWLNATIDLENITEISGAAKLSQFRAQQDNFRDLSFSVISAVGEHAALVHYSPTAETDKQITRDNVYLVDSGGQYLDGTTDVTRTLHFGQPSAEQRTCYTRVLKGFIAFATSVFPKTTTLNYFDNMARRALWQAGLNYGHGTGHGVGMYLSVHEYPPLINGRDSQSTLQPNVFTSNEPGYYKANEFGIRIEDVVQVVESELADAFEGSGAFTFRSITYAPLATNLIDADLLTKEEALFVNTYNRRVLDTIGPQLLKMRRMDTYEWLVQETRQICSWAK